MTVRELIQQLRKQTYSNQVVIAEADGRERIPEKVSMRVGTDVVVIAPYAEPQPEKDGEASGTAITQL